MDVVHERAQRAAYFKPQDSLIASTMNRSQLTLAGMLAICMAMSPGAAFAQRESLPSYLSTAESHARGGNWETAYRFVEDGLVSKSPAVVQAAQALLNKYPALKRAAFTTFLKSALSDSSMRYGADTAYKIERARLEKYAVFATAEDLATATATFEEVFPRQVLEERHRKERIAEEERQAKLLASMTEAEIKEAEAKRQEQIRLQKEMQEQAERAAAERKAKAELEAEEAYQRSLAELSKAKSLARFSCKDKAHCDKAFAWAQIFMSENATMKIQTANDTIIETYNATDSLGIAMKAIKVPGSGTTAEVIMSASCKGDSLAERHYCVPKLASILAEFPGYMRANVKR